MGAKRALIVDDSKSARVFLARALEQYDIDVDNAESAEAAIEYLGSHRPDVIFMDHLMPGMDGLQAVRAIKNDPRTATIPIMMYTSEDGELYLGQVRALGAIGVLPKQIKPTDVSKVLYQLHLVPERRIAEQRSFSAAPPRAVEAPPREPVPLPPPAAAAGPPSESALREQLAELRALIEARPAPQPPAPSSSPPWAWIVAGVALAMALASTALWWRSVKLLDALAIQVAQLRERTTSPAAAAAPATALPESAPPTAAPATLIDSKPLVVAVPYGSDPLGGARLEAIRQLLARLVKQKLAHLVDVRTFAGRFCLVGSATEGYSLPPDEMPFARCDLVGNPPEEVLAPTQRTPLALANLIASTRSGTGGAIDVQVSVGDAANVLVPYPVVAGDISAGDWNRAGAANNRVEIRVR